jgi:hypothetical protein
MKPDEMYAASSPVVSHKIRQKALPQFFALDVTSHSFTAPIRLLCARMIVE